MKIALISCTKKKKKYPCKAEELYSESTLFTKALEYVKSQNYDKYFIISALYGLVHPDQIIEPYNITLNKMKKEERYNWSLNVYNDLMLIKGIHSVDFYAGKNYREYLISFLEEKGIRVTVPLEGLQFGEQLQFYKKELDKKRLLLRIF